MTTGMRYPTLDVIRGVAVMGILLANLPLFALPEAAAFSPLAWGGSGLVERAVWFANFVLVEGKMRGLFSLLFGASLLLVIDGAGARGENPVAVHLRRMAVLFAIGCVHLYFFWSGDILSHYALVACFALPFVRLSVRWLVGCAILLLALQVVISGMAGTLLLASAARDTPQAVEIWDAFASGFGVPSNDVLASEIAAIRGGFLEAAGWRWRDQPAPFTVLPIVGVETLSMMLLGMAGLRSGFLTGAWPRARYRRWAIVGLSLGLASYGALGWNTMAHGFDQRWVYWSALVIAQPFRTLMTLGYAAAVVSLVGGGALTRRIAAVGRTALSNYLGTTLLMTFLFSGWGLNQFARWDRAALYLLAPPAWGLMLLWSQPWLARFRFGPVEWLWRSVARGRLQPMRGAAA